MTISGLSRYVVGIDLGTTNSVCAYVDTHGRDPAGFHQVLQRINEQDWQSRITLPSFIYLPGPHELPPGSISLPWNLEPSYVVGEFARVQGSRVPGRTVTSAKSWLCHGGVERTAAILPWEAPPDVARISPVEASARLLSHMRDSWNFEMPEPMEVQELVITVPASFNEVARELTVAAAQKAGLDRFRLLEEPQAAFYSWLFQREKTWAKELGDIRLVLVCDVGGGTSDFTLIRIDRSGDRPELVRIAVGDHIMLGGDNMDLALAHHVETGLGDGDTEVRLDARQWGILVQECRNTKERLLGEEPPERLSITLPGSGARLLGGMIQGELTREDATRLVLDGFFPFSELDESPLQGRRSGLTEWGLPYAADPAVPRHLSEFLRIHGAGVPDAVLFNGAALTPPAVRQRLVSVLEHWGGHPVREIPNPWLDRAVAHGAACYGLVRRGRGPRIGGGTGRSYYVKVATDQEAPASVCLVSARMGEGDEATIQEPALSVLVDQPVSFPLLCSSTRPGDEPGDLVALSGDLDFDPLPPLRTVLKARDGAGEIPVHIQARVTEIGTLELWCVGTENRDRWRLQFDLRGEALPSGPDLGVSRETLAQSRELIYKTFRAKPGKVQPGAVRPKTVLAAIEDMVRMRREEWPTAVLRELWEALDRVRERRRSIEQYEGPWFNAVGWCMRPGFGFPLDEWRIDRLWDIFPRWLQWFRDTSVRLEWWVMWRRVAGGLNEEQQARIFADLAPALLPGRKHVKTFPRPQPTASEQLEMWRLAASLERISAPEKALLGDIALDRVRRRGSGSHDYWLLARIGSRIPFAASPHHALSPEIVVAWSEEVLRQSWGDPQAAGFALSQMARFTGDRTRDLPLALREQVAARLRAEGQDESLARPVLEVVDVAAAEQVQILGDTLPVGLRLRSTSQ